MKTLLAEFSTVSDFFAVYADDLAGDATRAIRQKEANRGRNLLGASDTRLRNPHNDPIERRAFDHLGFNRPGRYAVHRRQRNGATSCTRHPGSLIDVVPVVAIVDQDFRARLDVPYRTKIEAINFRVGLLRVVQITKIVFDEQAFFAPVLVAQPQNMQAIFRGWLATKLSDELTRPKAFPREKPAAVSMAIADANPAA